MRYEKISTLTVKNSDKRSSVMKMLDNAGCLYFVTDLPSGSSDITVLEKAEPDPIDINTAIELIAAYNKAVVENQANIPAELLSKVRNLNIIEVAESMRLASLSIVQAIKKLNLFTLCKANGIPIGSPDSSDDGVKLSADDYRLLMAKGSCMDEIISLITSDNEMMSMYKEMLTDVDDIAQFSEGKVNMLGLLEHARDILSKKMFNMSAAIESEKNNLKLFCATIVQDKNWSNYVKFYLNEKLEKFITDAPDMADAMSDWVTFTGFFLWVKPLYTSDINESICDACRVVVNELWTNNDIRIMLKSFCDEEHIDLDSNKGFDIGKNFDIERMIKFINYIAANPGD